jgi:hypothetical protein
LAKELEEVGEKRVVRPEHHGWTDKCGVGKGGPYRQFAFAPFVDIKGGRGSVRADPRNVYEPLHPSEACLSSDPLRRFDMDGMKRFPSVLDVKTNRIHDTVSAGHRISDRTLVVNIGFNELKLRIIESE